MSKKKFEIIDLLLIAMFTVLITVGAFIKIPLPPVPITLQTFFTSLVALVLGAKRGAISVALYVLLGLVGLPVFTAGGGFGYIFHPTFGYLIGMILGTFVAGLMKEKAVDTKKENNFLGGYIIPTIVNMIIVYAVGVPYLIIMMKLYIGSSVAISALLMSGLVMTIPGGIIKTYLASLIAYRLEGKIRV